MNSGYPLEWFAEQVDDYLKCGICNKVMINPRATSCGHVFCKDCLQSWIEYYGVCPERCGEVELQQVTSPLHIQKRISGLLVRCKYVRSGCNIKVPLLDKANHEAFCVHQASDPLQELETRRRHSAEERLISKPGFSRSNTTGSAPPASEPVNKMQSQHTYRLKRSRQKEPLGLVVLSGAKTSDGRPKDFFVKKVNPSTPASKAGLRPGDRIIQIDNHDLWKISVKEAVSRIKDRPSLTLTIVRWENLDHSLEGQNQDNHIYDEILYADLSQPLLSQDENFPPFPSMYHNSPSCAGRLRPPMNEELQNQPIGGPASPSAAYVFRTSQPQKVPTGENGSKDSGLSSGSSGSPRPLPRNLERVMGVAPMPGTGSSSNLDRNVGSRHLYGSKREVLHPPLVPHQLERFYAELEPDTCTLRGRIEGDYEVEEIYLEKNGTSQLGVTLGYDTKSPQGQLYVCELTHDGLAAKDGRIQPGDIIKRVNGFEVYDPEEAVLLFLEQDQDITLTIARKLKNKPTSSGQSRSGRPRSFETLEQMGMEGDLRRVESCGSLDSHAFKPERETQKRSPLCQQRPASRENMDIDSEEYEMGSPERSQRALSPRRFPRAVSPGRSPQAVSPGKSRRDISPHYHSQQLHPAVAPEHTFKPIPAHNHRPKTAFNHSPFSPQLQRSSPNPRLLVRPSSATPDSRRRIHHQPVRHSSFATMGNQTQQRLPRQPHASQGDFVYTRNESLV